MNRLAKATERPEEIFLPGVSMPGAWFARDPQGVGNVRQVLGRTMDRLQDFRHLRCFFVALRPCLSHNLPVEPSLVLSVQR